MFSARTRKLIFCFVYIRLKRSVENFPEEQPSLRVVYVKKGVLKNFAKFTGKHLCHGLFLNKAAGISPATLLKKGFGTGIFL